MKNNQIAMENFCAVIDNRPMYRAGIKKTILSIFPEYVFAEYGSLSELPGNSSKYKSMHFFIRVGNTPNKTTIENVKKLRFAHGFCKVILYDCLESAKNIISFFRENIDAYLPDTFDEDELRECMMTLKSNKLYLNTQISVHLLTVKSQVRAEKQVRLTPGETKVANLLVTGMRPSLIAKELDLKISTISTVKSHIYKKTNVNNIIDLISAIDKSPAGYKI